METIIKSNKKTRIVTIPEYATMRGVTVSKVESWVKQNRITTLRQNGKTVIDVDASEKPKETEETKVDENQLPSPEVLLQTLLIKAEASVHKSDISRKRWQFLSFVSLMLFTGALYTVIWVYMGVDSLTKDQSRLHMDKYTLTEQLHSANTKVTGLSRQVGLLRNQNDQLAIESANLRVQNSSLSNNVKSLNQSTDNDELKYAEDEPRGFENKSHQTQRTPQDQSRLNAIRKGIYPQDMTKDELIASLGEPDRVYKGKLYEQLVYFDRSPGRFWFKNGPFLEAAE